VAATEPAESRLGQFIQKYHGFLSSFVIGVAGLVATTIWQFRQAEITRRQADSQEEIAKTKADNDWRIARAEILAKNLDVLADQKRDSADRRFGVLLSLTRSNIIDPELAVSYALELGKDIPPYMRAVLASTRGKSYAQLAQAFAMTCLQRFGVERPAEICQDDRLQERSAAIADLVRDEMEAANQLEGQHPADQRAVGSPMSLLVDEDEVQRNAPKLSWLFEPYLQSLYEHRRWRDIERFETFSGGARLVGAITFATSRTGELVSEVEAKQLDDFHSQRRHWLASYLLGRRCDPDCRSRIVEFMLSTVQEADGEYDQVLRDALLRPRSEIGRAIDQIHTRLLWCQIDPDDLALLRDRVLVPALAQVVAQPPKDPVIGDDLVSLFALTTPPTDPAALARYNEVRAAFRPSDRLERLYNTRQARARRQRASPPPMIKRVSFCGMSASEEEK
jgi:hypothetical protein